MNSHFIELWAELFEFEPLYGIPAIFFSRITGDAREALLRIGHRSAFSALEGDNDPSSLILGHELIRCLVDEWAQAVYLQSRPELNPGLERLNRINLAQLEPQRCSRCAAHGCSVIRTDESLRCIECSLRAALSLGHWSPPNVSDSILAGRADYTWPALVGQS